MIDLNIVPVIVVVITGYVILMRILTKQVANFSSENIKLRLENSNLQDDLFKERNINNELEIELKKKVSDLTELVNQLQQRLDDLSKRLETEETLRKFFENQADKNNQVAIEERERRIVAETELKVTKHQLNELKQKIEKEQ